MVILFISVLNPWSISAQGQTDPFFSNEIAVALDSIASLPDTGQQFFALRTLALRNTGRMNPFTVQFLETDLNDLSLSDPVVPAAAQFLFGEFFHVNLQQFNLSLFHFRKALELAPPGDESLKLRIWERISATALQLPKLEEAIPATDSCIFIARQQQHWFMLARCLECKGNIRRDYFQENAAVIPAYREALVNYKKSYRQKLERTDTLAALYNLVFISALYLDSDSLAHRAAPYIDTAFTLIHPAIQYDGIRPQIHLLKGKMLSHSGHIAAALNDFGIASEQFVKNGDSLQLSHIRHLVGKLLFRQGDYLPAIEQLQASLKLPSKVKSPGDLSDIHHLLYLSHKTLGAHEDALTAHEAYLASKDQISQTNQMRFVAAMEAERGLQEKQEKIQEQIVELGKKIFINRFLLVGSLLLLVLTGALLYSFLRTTHARNALAKSHAIISEQKKRLEEVDDLKSRFFTNISHELRTPLTLILAPIQRLLDTYKMSMEEKGLLKTAEKNTLKLMELVNELLEFSKMEAGKIKNKPAPCLIHTFTHQIYTSFLPLAEAKKIQLIYHCRLDSRLTVQIDRSAYQKILNNLLSNALKFSSEDNQVIIDLSENKKRLLLTVIDNGPGIHPEDLPFIFDRFYQVSYQVGRKESSTGIGLAFSAELARMMGGQLQVESTWGKGSRFILQLPKIILKKAKMPLPKEKNGHRVIFADQQNSSPGSSTPDAEEKPVVLIVEDQEDLNLYLSRLLSEYYDVYTASNGKEALEVLSHDTSPFLDPGKGLIISDLMMPEMDGHELLKKLKENDQYAHLPVIILSAVENRTDRLKALTVGVDDYLVKPFDHQELLIRVHNLLNRSRERVRYWNSISNKDEGNGTLVDSDSALDTRQMKWLKDLESYSLKHISDSQFGVAYLSNYAHMSERNFQRHIKKTTGLTPSEYIKEIRLHHARQLLESGKVSSVKAASKAVGFNDQEYFSNLFYERFGRRPSTYLG